MIRLFLGLQGSGKTAAAVREMIKNKRPVYTNIIMRHKTPHVKKISHEMIIRKEIVRTEKSGKPVYDYKLNTEYWKSAPKPCDVVIDEAHNIFNARNSMTKQNRLISQWLALLRRVIGGSSGSYGELIMISQLGRQVDIIGKEMASQVQYHIMHSIMQCSKCGYEQRRTSQDPEHFKLCRKCGGWRFKEHGHFVMVYKFADYSLFEMWRDFGSKSYYRHYIIKDIADYFKYYDTQQWESMFENVYD